MPSVPLKDRTISQHRVKLTRTILVSERYALSDRATAAVSSSVLADYAIIKENDISLAVDKSKVARERKRVRHAILKIPDITDELLVSGIYFDGRRDKTLYNEVKEKKIVS